MKTETPARPMIFDQLAALADGLRSRLLLALEGRELTVSELCAVLQLPQSTVSRHLKTLADTAWVVHRPDGTKRLYQFDVDAVGRDLRELWLVARRRIAENAVAAEDARRLESVLAERRSRSRAFFDEGAERWDRMRDEMFGDRFYLFALLGLLEPELALAELGCGTGPVSEALAPMVRELIAVDGSETMLAAARQRLRRFDNVELRRGELEALPLGDASVDAATLILVLHHLPEPIRVLREVRRILRDRGRVLLVDMLPHERLDLQQEVGHVWLGFDQDQIGRMLAGADLRLQKFVVLPPSAAAMGPTLFAATAVA